MDSAGKPCRAADTRRDQTVEMKVNIQVPWGGKGKIAKDVCNEYGTSPQEVLAIGDSSSDIEIFQFVKYSISINAPEEVSKITTWTVKELGEIPGIIKKIENKH